MAASAPITSQKSAFLNRQVRALSAPLTVPPSAHTTLPSLPDKTLTDLVSKSNEKIRHHNRSVFSAQATRHIAEQIETLYWNEVRAEREARGALPGETVVKRETDLGTSEGLTDLGEGWENVVVAADDDEEQEGGREAPARYAEMRAQLLELTARRDEAQERLLRYGRLRELLEPYAQPQERIQPNLVTKDGELVRELEKMRVLLTRVTARMGEQKELQGQGVTASAGNEEAPTFEEKLATLMDTT